MKYLKQFVVGSSFLVFFQFYYSAKNHQPKKTYDYYRYTLVAPIWFGLWNIISLIIAEKYKLNFEKRFLLISFISALSIMIISTKLRSYNFTRNEWYKYYVYILIKYLFTWNVIIKNIEKNL